MRPLHIHFDAGALRHNHRMARQHAGESTRLWCVVKADAYGHGLMRTAEALTDLADGFALIELEGAIALRQAGFRQPILMLEGFYHADELSLFAHHDLTPVLHSPPQIETFLKRPLPTAYLKLNTGMNRLGLNECEFTYAFNALRHVTDVTVMTHFADADDIRGVDWQMTRLTALWTALGDPLVKTSLANSAALLRYPKTVGHWARPGIMLYGSSPFQEVAAAALDLQPVMTLESEVIALRDLKQGERIGYGGTFTAEKPMRIAMVACGYGDGYPRHATTGTPILVGHQRTRTLGRVSMDKLCVDITGRTDVNFGTSVILWGKGLPVEEVAAAAGTITYELFCAATSRH
ncbi:MAG: alanine racemase [Rhodocyclaceae bacterium]|nr:alanine racemase [Rhodocyclaceae bacterium]